MWFNKIVDQIVVVRLGLILSIITILFGFILGGFFGAAEDNIKDFLKNKAENAPAGTYENQEAKDKIVSKSWAYFKRSHIHANGIGTTAVVLILVLSVIPSRFQSKSILSFCLGLGALLYALFWLFAGINAPGLGSTGAAKEQLQWLAIPGAGLCILGVFGTLITSFKFLFLTKH